MKDKLIHKMCLFFVIITCCSFLLAQTPDSTKNLTTPSQKIELRTYVESNQVPLNRIVVYRVELSWIGNLNRYRIEPLTQPALTNLILEGSGSENRLEPLGNGSFRAFKSITYRFKPLEMGMAYVDGIVVKYTDNETGQEDQLASQRVTVEIVEPMPEAGGAPLKSLLFIVLFLLFFGVIATFLFLFFRKRKIARHSVVPQMPLPETYLNRLSHEVDPRGTNLNEMTIRLSRIFREYIDEDFDINARESSTSEVLEKLSEKDLNETDLKKLKEIFEHLDAVKFAGKSVDPASFSNLYGAVEAFLRKRNQIWQSIPVDPKEA